MKATVFGVVTRLGNGVAIRSAAGRTLDAYAIDDFELELEGADIDLDHEGEPVGQIIYAEIDHDRLAIVGVVDGALAAIAEERDVFFSGSYVSDDGAHGLRERSSVVARARMIGMALTLQPLNSSAQAVRWLPGDLRRSSARNSWPISWRSSHPLLKRAHEHGLSESSVATKIVDLRQDAGVENYPWHALRTRHTWLPTDELERPAGPLRYSAHRGRVLRVS